MLPPYELQNKPFKTALKGYNPAEVDEHLEFVQNKYTELYRAYNELERRFAACEAELEQFRKNEDAIHRALVNAQNAGSRIMQEAGDRSQLILQSTKDRCKHILADFDQEIRRKQDALQALKTEVFEFKSRMFTIYREHIELLEAISPEGEDGKQWQLAPEDYVSNVIGQIVLDVDAADAEHPTIGLTDPPKIKIDEETLESLMQNGRQEENSSPAVGSSRSEFVSDGSHGDGRGVSGAVPTGEASSGKMADISLEAGDEAAAFGHPKH